MVSAELLLPVWERGSDNGAGRELGNVIQDLQSGSAGLEREYDATEAGTGLLFIIYVNDILDTVIRGAQTHARARSGIRRRGERCKLRAHL